MYDFLIVLACLVMALVGLRSLASADSWSLPKVTSYESSDLTARFTVIPRPLESQLDYFSDAIEGDSTPGQLAGTHQQSALGFLEARQDSGAWAKIWRGPLVNNVAPVSALVTNDASHFVTFDNWHSVGHGDTVIVIYSSDGRVVRSMALTDIVPDYYFNALRRTVSSVSWKCDAKLSETENTLALSLNIPSIGKREQRCVDVHIDLLNGEILQREPEKWAQALSSAKLKFQDDTKKREIADRKFREDLGHPETNDAGDWNMYLVEAYFRLGSDGYPAVRILQSKDNKMYEKSAARLSDELLDADNSSKVIMMAAANSPDDLLEKLSEIMQAMPNKLLEGKRLFVAGPASMRARFELVMQPSGAEFTYLDNQNPIPQSLDRLASRFANR